MAVPFLFYPISSSGGTSISSETYFPFFFSLTNALGKKILDLSVDRAKVILRPRRDGGIQLWRQAKGDLLFSLIVHLSKGFPS